ncbi:MAG TPA: hypothetical protein VNA12_07395 [Mycobacteriales bacterium]|nr:hypothetical protein [Mycobacteriales bacterium]
MTEPDRDLQPTRSWTELMATSRRRGTTLRRRRRALTAAPLLAVLATTLVITIDDPRSAARSELDITDRPPVTSPAPGVDTPLPELVPEPPQPGVAVVPNPRSEPHAAERRPETGARRRPSPIAAPRVRTDRGPRVVFSSARDGDHDIYLMNADGSDVRALTVNDVPEFDPTPSPDGRWIVFGSNDDLVGGLFIMRSDGSGRRRLTQRSCTGDDQTCTVGWASWSPNGEWIAFTNGFAKAGCDAHDNCASVWLVRPDGTGLRELTKGWEPTWSPDSRRLAFVDYAPGADRTACDAVTSCRRNLFLIDADGRGRTDLDVVGESPAWSPVAPVIAFTMFNSVGYRVAQLDLRTGDAEDISDWLEPDEQGASPAWSRDGRRLLIETVRTPPRTCDPCPDVGSGYNWNVAVVDLVTQRKSMLTQELGHDLAPNWLYG